MHTVRTPYEVIPSALSMFTTMWRIGSPRVPLEPALETMYRVLVQMYKQAEESLARLPERSRVIVRYPDLTADPQRTVEQIYERCGLEQPQLLVSAAQLAAGQRTQSQRAHRYRLEDFGLQRERIREDLGFVFDRYNFPRWP